jgi:hypothetical protein
MHTGKSGMEENMKVLLIIFLGMAFSGSANAAKTKPTQLSAKAALEKTGLPIKITVVKNKSGKNVLKLVLENHFLKKATLGHGMSKTDINKALSEVGLKFGDADFEESLTLSILPTDYEIHVTLIEEFGKKRRLRDLEGAVNVLGEQVLLTPSEAASFEWKQLIQTATERKIAGDSLEDTLGGTLETGQILDEEAFPEFEADTQESVELPL